MTKICSETAPEVIGLCQFYIYRNHLNRPFAQLLSGLETGHPAAAGPSPAYDFSVSTSETLFFLSPFWTVLGVFHRVWII